MDNVRLHRQLCLNIIFVTCEWIFLIQKIIRAKNAQTIKTSGVKYYPVHIGNGIWWMRANISPSSGQQHTTHIPYPVISPKWIKSVLPPTERTRKNLVDDRGQIQRKTWCMGTYAGVDYNLTLCPLQSRLQHIYHGQPYARVDLNPVPESTLSPSQGLWIWPQVIFFLAVLFFFSLAMYFWAY